MRYLFNPALVLFTILVCSNLSATDPAQLADSIRQQAQGKATDQRPTPIQQAFGQYGHDPASTPLEIQKAATEFLKAAIIDKPLIIPPDRRHGVNRQFEGDYNIALMLADASNTATLDSAVALAQNPTASLGLRSRAMETLNGNDEQLLRLGNSLERLAQERTDVNLANQDKVIALKAFARMQNPTDTAAKTLLDELTTPTVHMEDSVVPTLMTGSLSPAKADICLRLANVRPQYAALALRSIRDSTPQTITPLAIDLRKFFNNRTAPPEARASAALALAKIQRPVPDTEIIELIPNINDRNLPHMLVKTITDQRPLTDEEKQTLGAVSVDLVR